MKRIAFFAVLCLMSGTAPFAQETAFFEGLKNIRGENLTIKIVVAGPGDELYFWWGHIALMIENSVTGRSNFYDYGLFSFQNENFFYNFAFGRLLFSCGASPAENNFAVYVKTNRSIIVYTLDIPPEKRMEVLEFAEDNIRPEKRDYYYHHFKDNCSTRIRDIVDIATDGQFKEQYGDVYGGFTFREHVRRHTWFSPAIDWILNFWMGQDIDRPITIWEDMFLPSEVGKRIEDFIYTDSAGVSRKLVSKVEAVYRAEGRPAVLEVPRTQWPRELAFSLAVSLLLGFFFYLQAKNYRAGQILAGISMSFAGLVFGIAGLFLYFMSIFTNHDYTYHNANMLFGSPLLLAAVPLGIRYAQIKDSGRRFVCGALLRLLWLLTALGIFISMVIKLLPRFWQDNLTDQMLMLPIALVFALQPVGLRELLDRTFKRKK